MCLCVCLHENLKTTRYCRYLLSTGSYVDWTKISEEFAYQGQGYFSEGSRSLGKIMSYSVAGSEILHHMASSDLKALYKSVIIIIIFFFYALVLLLLFALGSKYPKG